MDCYRPFVKPPYSICMPGLKALAVKGINMNKSGKAREICSQTPTANTAQSDEWFVTNSSTVARHRRLQPETV